MRLSLAALLPCLLLAPALALGQEAAGQPAAAEEDVAAAGTRPSEPKPAEPEKLSVPSKQAAPAAPASEETAASPVAPVAASPAKNEAAPPVAASPARTKARQAPEPGAVKEKPVPSPPAPPPAPSAPVAEERRTAKKPGVDAGLNAMAITFYRALAARDLDTLTALSRPPFFFEGEAVATTEEIRGRWSESLQGGSTPGLRLFDVELFGVDDLVAKYGKPPEKLAAWPMKGAMISVGNLEGHAVLVLWRRSGSAWQAHGIHD